jgi:hypothetical protein
MPWTETVIVSFSLPGVIVTLPPACGRQAAMPADGTSLNVKDLACALATVAPAELAVSAAVTARPMALVAAAINVSTRRLGVVVYFMIGNLLSRWRPCRRRRVLAFPGPGMSGRGTRCRGRPVQRELRKVHAPAQPGDPGGNAALEMRGRK